jgi:hypothetical protein
MRVTAHIQGFGPRLGKPDDEWWQLWRHGTKRDDVERRGFDRRRGPEIVEQEAHRREQLIVRKDDHAARRSQRNGRAEILIFGVQKIDQRASPDLVFLAVNGDGLPLSHELTLQRGDAIRGDCSCCPGFVDGFECVALQTGMPHRFFRVTLGHLGAPPCILPAAKNIPRHDDFARNVIASADE